MATAATKNSTAPAAGQAQFSALETRFVALMSQLFQLDEAEALDFGLYRVIRRHNREVRAFLGEIIAPYGAHSEARALQGGQLAALLDSEFAKFGDEAQVDDSFRLKDLAEKLGLKPGWTQEQCAAALTQADSVPVAQALAAEYRRRRATLEQQRNVHQDRAEVLNRLYQFFARHYQDGDFIVERRYGKGGARYVKSTGEDTEFHWATEDMYYIKSGDIFTDFPVHLSNGQRLLFTVDAESLQATRAALKPNDKAHYELGAAIRENERLKVRLNYLKGTQSERQKDEIIAAVQQAGVGVTAEHGGEIRRWLNRFMARNQSDFFIHRRLQAALSEDLDIFLKAEVLDVDQLLAGGDLPQRAMKVARIVRQVGGQIIAFLGALEDAQKALWEKKKLVFETRYVITLDRLQRYCPDWLAQNIGAIVEQQRQEWQELGLGDIANADACRRPVIPAKAGIQLALHEPPGLPYRLDYLPLPLDTQNFNAAFKWDLLDAVTATTPLDAALDGVAIQSDNWQALNTVQEKYREQVKCIYIDPPYNTGGDGFPYKDSYPHSSWLAMMDNRLALGQTLMTPDAAWFVSLDDREHANFRQLANQRLGAANFVANVIWQKNYSPKNSARHFSEDHDHILVYARSGANWLPALLPRTAEMEARYLNPDKDLRGPWKPGDLSARNPYSEGVYPITGPSGRVIPGPPPGTYWRVSKTKFEQLDRDKRIWWGVDGNNVPAIKRFLSEVKQGRVPQTIWPYQEVGHTQDAKKELLAYTNLSVDESVFNTPKPSALIRQVLKLATDADREGEWVADFFAGSGTTGHAVLAQNHEDKAGRRFLLVECNAYFENLLVHRLKKAATGPDWKKGGAMDGSGLFMRVQTLEQYDDTLENLDSEIGAGDSGELSFEEPAFALRYRLDKTARALYCGVERFTSPFGYRLKRAVGAAAGGAALSGEVDLVESLPYLLGMEVSRLYREAQGVVLLGRHRRGQTLAVFFRDGSAKHSPEWVAEKLAQHPADRVFTNDMAGLSFEGCERLEAIETIFAGQFGRN